MGKHNDPLQPHSHDPNPAPPSADPTLRLRLPDGQEKRVTVFDLAGMRQSQVSNCFIVSTGHGTSGPFSFSGVSLIDLVQGQLEESAMWSQVEVISRDGFGTRIRANELYRPHPAGTILLSTALDGRPLSRAEGLVRLIVPSETDDALRQVKWIERINIR